MATLRDIKIPIYTIGDQDGQAVEGMNREANGTGLKTHLTLGVQNYPDLKEDIVIGKLAGNDG